MPSIRFGERQYFFVTQVLDHSLSQKKQHCPAPGCSAMAISDNGNRPRHLVDKTPSHGAQTQINITLANFAQHVPTNTQTVDLARARNIECGRLAPRKPSALATPVLCPTRPGRSLNHVLGCSLSRDKSGGTGLHHAITIGITSALGCKSVSRVAPISCQCLQVPRARSEQR